MNLCNQYLAHLSYFRKIKSQQTLFQVVFDSETGTHTLSDSYSPVTVFGYTKDDNGVEHPQYAKFKTRIASKTISKAAGIDPMKFKPKSDIVSLIRHYNDMANLLHSPAADFDLEYLTADGEPDDRKKFFTYLGKRCFKALV